MKKVLLIVSLMLIAWICFAQTPGHPNIVQFVRTSPTTGTIRWSAEPSLNVSYYYLAVYPTISQYFAPSYCDPAWNVPGDWAASFDTDGPGFYKKDVIGLNAAEDYYAYVAAVETGGWTWGAYSSWESDLETLPVVLSSFSATLTALNYVALAWTTQSETNLQGYRLYRSETPVLNEALMITPTLITATNTSNVSNYSFEDREVEVNHSYWYWLESVEYAGGSMHGPTNVLVTGDDPNTPNLPQTTAIRRAYPNPFSRANSINVEIDVKAGDNAQLTIYNARGQAIRTIQLSEGSHNLEWNGRDDSDSQCTNGLYLFRLKTDGMISSKKIMLVN